MTDLTYSRIEVDDDGLHDCARGDHCAARTTTVEAGQRITVPAQTYRALCDADRTHVLNCLDELPGLYSELRARIGDKSRSDGPRVSGGGKTAPVILNLAVDALLRHINTVVLSWDERVRVVAGFSDLAAATTDTATTTGCVLLARHVDTLLGLPAEPMSRRRDLTQAEHLPLDATGLVHPEAGWVEYNTNLTGADAGLELLALHHRCLRMLGHTPQHHDLITPCWECDERSLRRHDGTAGLADHVECMRCREQYLGSRLSALMVEEEQAQLRKRDREAQQEGQRRQVLHSSVAGFGGRP
ncbi:hypothetical protein ACGFNU_21445 [Spirillospora sp. NPDC048911]|uniref:hypothetical protein n=1 Tax=Spirillospora sp. NPDC048911 TaxID=3364527 RepID=UPI00371F35E3